MTNVWQKLIDETSCGKDEKFGRKPTKQTNELQLCRQ
jgi:hypothetical protein